MLVSVAHGEAKHALGSQPSKRYCYIQELIARLLLRPEDLRPFSMPFELKWCRTAVFPWTVARVLSRQQDRRQSLPCEVDDSGSVGPFPELIGVPRINTKKMAFAREVISIPNLFNPFQNWPSSSRLRLRSAWMSTCVY
jgi:hypothetical protein